MNCRQCRDILDGLLVEPMDEFLAAEVHSHVEQCDSCARELAAAQQALAILTPTNELRASPELRKHIMNAISTTTIDAVRPTSGRTVDHRTLRWLAAAAVAAAILIAAVTLLRPAPESAPGPRPGGEFSAFGLLAQACAAEELAFTGDRVVHLENEIIVHPTDDPVWIGARWLPVISLDANGKTQFNQLTLSAEAGKGYTIKDSSWYDPPSGRFVRILTADKKPVFANAYDGKAVYSLEVTSGANTRVARKEVSEDFHPPSSPAEYLGIATGIRSSLGEKSDTNVADAGDTTLDDGTKARVLKAGIASPEGDGPVSNAYYLFTIRDDDKTVAKMEFMADGKPLLTIRRVLRETVDEPEIPWNLAGVAARAKGTQANGLINVLPNMVVPKVSVQHMVDKAKFETYVFSKDPAWAGPREITDILDVASPPERMFAIAHKADDGRHVVLVQSPSYNKMLGPMVEKMGKVVYTSPGGVKVFSSSRDKWLAGILLQSAQASIGPANAKDRTGYLLHTPAGTFPALAVNGTMTDDEMHALVDSLVPAKEHLQGSDGNR